MILGINRRKLFLLTRLFVEMSPFSSILKYVHGGKTTVYLFIYLFIYFFYLFIYYIYIYLFLFCFVLFNHSLCHPFSHLLGFHQTPLFDGLDV